MMKLALYQRYWDSSIHVNDKCNLLYKKTKRQYPHVHLIRCRKSLWKNPAAFQDKYYGETRDIGDIYQHNKDN